MEHLIIPEDYFSRFHCMIRRSQSKRSKTFSERTREAAESAPCLLSLFVDPASGMNDNLNGIERPVSFGIKEQNERQSEIVQSLAKWKRYALKEYGFAHGEGFTPI